MRPSSSLLLLVVAALCGCASKPAPQPPPTLKSLESRTYLLPESKDIATSDETTMQAYRDYLKSAPHDPQRPEALRRLGDLEMDSADTRSATGTGASGGGGPNYERAVSQYRDFLKAYPQDPNNDRVLYQLARAYEQGGDLEAALRTLSQLVQQFPNTKYLDEANFRRGELLFSTRSYVAAEEAYATVLHSATRSAYYERSLYMQGWSLYKQGRLEEALHSFFGVLDLKLIGKEGEGKLEELPGLTRADRELVEDTFRVVSLCLENLQGAESIPEFVRVASRHDYEFRVYEQLGELYMKQERVKDAADTFSAFARRNPLNAQAPMLQARVIDIYQRGGFESMALEAKKEYVERYGVNGEFRRANAPAWERTRPLVKTYLGELTRYYHAAAQKSKKSEDYQAAVHWYREFLQAFPSDPQAAQANFLLAELLFEDSRFAEAAPEYEKAAYQYPAHAKSADAGYAALLSYAEQEKRTTNAGDRDRIERASIESALRFGATFAADPRTGPVLTNAAEKLYALHQLDRAMATAQLVLKLKPPAAAAQQRVAWTVIAHSSFESGKFDQAEHGYTEVLALTPPTDPGRGALTERLAAAVYKQGEQARAEGRLREAVDHFQRVGTLAPDSPVRATAQFDAAAVLIGLKDWPKAARTLEDFRQRYPNHPLQNEISEKLAVVYSESGQWAAAAGEYERLSGLKKEPQLARAALWQAAELYEKAGARSAAAKAYEHYVRQHPEPLEPAMEARYRLARIAKEEGGAALALPWMREMLQADQAGGSGRTNRTRYLAATAALALAEPVSEEYKKVQLVEPLKKQLKLKKAKMEDALKAYAVAADYGVADVATAATFHTAELYQDFGRALLSSQRPKGLSKDEVEQYNVMLEEQAFPFEEKAIELHEVNARRSATGIYDQWVKGSFSALAQLRPVRYAKNERSEVAVDAIR
ncbi:MAG TPA: tetratricopeptide repeat protein [Burkholderiaceae bacterium]|nr:tetratricopeptide repeat protein [Burkholderiaceae bacterium]